MEEFDDLLQAPDDSGYLDLSHRAWSSLDDVLWSWGQSLIVLNVSFNNLKTISPGIGELSLLRELDASCNHIEALPEEIGKCVRLKKLKINGNRMEIFAKGNWKLQNAGGAHRIGKCATGTSVERWQSGRPSPAPAFKQQTLSSSPRGGTVSCPGGGGLHRQ